MISTNIREARLEDLSGLLKLEQKIIDSERPYDHFLRKEDVSYYDIPHLIADSESHMVVVEAAGVIVGSGYAQVRLSRSCHTHDKHCYLGFIYLEPAYRGKAIGQGIIETLKEWGKAKGMQHYHLNVYSENESAIRAYEKGGFKKVSVLMELIE